MDDRFINRWPVYKLVKFVIGLQHIRTFHCLISNYKQQKKTWWGLGISLRLPNFLSLDG